MRTLRDEVLNRQIPVIDFTSAIELILDDKGHCAGAVLLNMETKEILIAKAKVVIIATGGAGRMHYQGFPTSNHYGATADGLILGYRAGAKLLYPDTLQYHPTGAAFPAQIYGALVTEKVRSVGAMLVNADGEVCAFTLTCNAGKEAHVGYAELVKTQLEQFGIQVVLETLDADSYNAKTSNKFSENNITMEAAIYGFTAAGMGMKNGLASIYVDGTHPVQGGCQVFDEEFQAILSTMGEAKTVEEYTAAAGSLQDWYAAHIPLIALYWDSQILVHNAAYENFTVDAVFGLNNANTWFSITAK